MKTEQRSTKFNLLHPARLGTFLLLSFLVISSFLIKWHNFQNTKLRTIDENVFYSVAKQLTTDPSQYHGRGFLERTRKDRDISSMPPYLSAPLFKHPPLFSYGLAFSLKVFGDRGFSVALIPLLSGSLLILVVYFLTRLISDSKTAILSAIIVALDPFLIISSQKVWMETPLTLLVTLSLYLYLKGFQLREGRHFILGGIAAGLAALTKYPGLLVVFTTGLYAVLYDRKRYRDIPFLMGLLIPFIFLLPWMLWNMNVYGEGFLVDHLKAHGFSISGTLFKILAFSITAGAAGYFLLKEKISSWLTIGTAICSNIRKPLSFLLLPLLFFLVMGSISKNLNFYDLPKTSWTPGLLSYEGPFIYFRRLVEFSLLYLFSFLSFFMTPGEEKKPLIRCAQITTLLYMIFYVLYGNYQMRYFLMAVPTLIILGTGSWMTLLRKGGNLPNLFSKNAARILLWGILAIHFIKTMIINVSVSFPNDMCYF